MNSLTSSFVLRWSPISYIFDTLASRRYMIGQDVILSPNGPCLWFFPGNRLRIKFYDTDDFMIPIDSVFLCHHSIEIIHKMFLESGVRFRKYSGCYFWAIIRFNKFLFSVYRWVRFWNHCVGSLWHIAYNIVTKGP